MINSREIMPVKSEKRIAILGATGHLAKGLIYRFSRQKRSKVFLFARSLERLDDFLNQIEHHELFHRYKFSEFSNHHYDVIINCVGVGTPLKVKKSGADIFKLTEYFDNLIIGYLFKHPGALYINFSSGAVYGTNFVQPVKETSQAKWNINKISELDYYGIAKFNSEAKHRALKALNIVDLRIFNYFTRYIELGAKYLITEMISCLIKEREFLTDRSNIMRDYIHPQDLFTLVEECISKGNINTVFDAYSLKPITKFEILNYFKSKYGLKYTIKVNLKTANGTGTKEKYYSNNKKAKGIGYNPRFSSLDCIVQESDKIISGYRK